MAAESSLELLGPGSRSSMLSGLGYAQRVARLPGLKDEWYEKISKYFEGRISPRLAASFLDIPLQFSNSRIKNEPSIPTMQPQSPSWNDFLFFQLSLCIHNLIIMRS